MTTKKRTKKRPPSLKKYNVEFWGKVYVSGVITVMAKDEQAARTAAFAEYQEEGIYWGNHMEDDENYPVRIHSVDAV